MDKSRPRGWWSIGIVLKAKLEGAGAILLHRPVDLANGICSWTIATSENGVYDSYHC